MVLIVDASLYPFSGWREIGLGAFDYLSAPWPKRALEFDMVVNVLGYFPLGLLAMFALYPKLRGALATGLVILCSIVLSGALEAIQTFLPTRVASKVDLVTNVAGATLGAVCGALLCEPILDRGRLREVRLQWFARDANFGIVIAALWFGAILYPQPFAFACGNLSGVLDVGFSEPGWLSFLREPSARGFTIEELVVSTCFLSAAGLLVLNLLRPFAPRTIIIFVYVVLCAIAKTLGTGLTYAPGEPFIWVTRGSFESVIGTAIILLGALYVSPKWGVWIAQLLLVAGLFLVNMLPSNPYFEGAAQDWAHGRLLNFYGLALGVSLAWPFVALAYLVRMRRTVPKRPTRSV